MSKNASDLELITKTIQLYFDGMYHSDVEKLRKAFHPNANLYGYLEGELALIPLDNWLAHVRGVPAPFENGEEYDMRIVSTDVTGAVATVKVADLYIGRRFTDYLSMVKIDDGWVIVNKTFHYDPEP
ncbi:MAG: nuclear transport factor 2 family protein [Deltaproteobacteria bacterium]|nr:nuclear transport factor 2 family protein [Deltaproteobacteria bacterium]MBW2052888.1 nuclear transport factor 2 family protein [Deltaproteobacteria bacterium]MBW2141408.1 nuclear transport factor 2 family protein [Deltaproteobacteria bacterium]MBW2324014.1 nuclear transport factor 2 family protein [Deltaproteobacteria bacterium]